MYCEATLKRQLASPDLLDPLEWARNARALSAFYINTNRWKAAADVLSASGIVAKRAVASRKESMKRRDPNSRGEEGSEEKSAAETATVNDGGRDVSVVKEGELLRVLDEWDGSNVDEETVQRVIAEGAFHWGSYYAQALSEARGRDLTEMINREERDEEERKKTTDKERQEKILLEEKLVRQAQAEDQKERALQLFGGAREDRWVAGPEPSKEEDVQGDDIRQVFAEAGWESVPGGRVWVHVECPDWLPAPVVEDEAASERGGGPPPGEGEEAMPAAEGLVVRSPGIEATDVQMPDGSKFNFMYMLSAKSGHRALYAEEDEEKKEEADYVGTYDHPFALVTHGKADSVDPHDIVDFESARDVFKKALVEFTEALVSWFLVIFLSSRDYKLLYILSPSSCSLSLSFFLLCLFLLFSASSARHCVVCIPGAKPEAKFMFCFFFQKFFKLDGFVTDHVAIQRGLSSIYKSVRVVRVQCAFRCVTIVLFLSLNLSWLSMNRI